VTGALTPLEIATATILGRDPVELPERPAHPLARLETLLLSALQTQPCGVAFSGGVDSSFLLALTDRVARREGLPRPIAMTTRYRGHPEASEDSWQERVVAHLGLPDWHRVEFTTEENFLGPYAQRALGLLGVHYPPNAYMGMAHLEALRGGVLIHGVDGDAVLAHSPYHRIRDVLFGPAGWEPRDVLRLAYALAPTRLKAARLMRLIDEIDLPWLRAGPRRAIRWAEARYLASEPVTWNRRIHWLAGARQYGVFLASTQRLAADARAHIAYPLLDEDFLSGWAAFGGRRGFYWRGQALRALAPGLLPDDVIDRQDKADLSSAVWSGEARVFADSWDGTGVDTTLVDVDALRAEWAKPAPHYGTSMLLQQAFLASVQR
jgi:asparagine synthase (glutamine-hydrolysing)